MMRAFSLVELSIVLVILGLLTGGILTGQSLIRASELRSVTTEHSRFTAAVQTFRDKYFAMPGDMNNATRFWGRQVNAAHCLTNSSAAVSATGVCDGNGNNVCDTASAANESGEIFQFWRQLANAGLVEGSYSGLAGSAGTGGDHVLGTNAPRSKLSNAGWGLWPLENYVGDFGTYAYNYGRCMIGFGAQHPTAWPLVSALRPEEAWNIDTKMDDGLPGSGRIIARDTPTWGFAHSCTTSTSQTDKPGAYRLANTNIACALHFTNLF